MPPCFAGWKGEGARGPWARVYCGRCDVGQVRGGRRGDRDRPRWLIAAKLLDAPSLSNIRRRSCQSITTTTTAPAFERTSKRRKGFPSETRVKRGPKGSWRTIRNGEVELLEKLGQNRPN